MIVIGIDYKFRDDMKYDTIPIEILMEPYRGVILRYTTVSFREEADGTPKILFQYDLLNLANHKEPDLRANKKFVEYIGLILNAMILDTLEVADDDQSGKNYSEELVDE